MPTATGNRPFRYYPGDAYVDPVFVDVYEHHEKRTQSLPEALEHFLSEMGGFLREREEAGDTAPALFPDVMSLSCLFP